MSEKQYSILDENGYQVGTVWATAVEPRDKPGEGFWFKRDSVIIASCWYGYKDIETKAEVFTPKPHPAPTSEVPA